MFAEGWLGQQRRVRRLNPVEQLKRNRERRLRHSLEVKSLGLLARAESLLMIGATGALWTTRLKRVEGEGRKRPIAELIGATLVVLRWRHLVGLFSTRRGS